MKTKSRLGRGLSSLMSIGEPEATVKPTIPAGTPIMREVAPLPTGSPEPASVGIASIPLESIVPNPHQPRRQMNEAGIAELAASLKSSGLIQPIVVRRSSNGYELIAGERRWRAAKVAGLREVPAIIRDATAFEQAQMALVENIQRENLNPRDRAAAYRALMNQLGLTQAELAGRMGEDRSSIANYLRLLDLPVPVQELLHNGQLSMGHAKVLAGISDPLEQERLSNLVVSQSLSVRNLERQIEQAGELPSVRSAAAPSPHYQELEKSLSQQLGTRVQLRSSANKKKGRLILHYTSLDQFDKLLSRLGVDVAET
jgi:ParB family chromosome partitioning protein